MSNNTINADVEHSRAFGTHVFAAGYGERYAMKPESVASAQFL